MIVSSERIHQARLLLNPPPPRRTSAWAALAASGVTATGAVLMAIAVILGPGVQLG